MSFLEVKNLSADYGKHRVIVDLSFAVEAGTVLGILGANGCGKTTLLKSICGILPYTGECLLAGENLAEMSPRMLARRCSYIQQRSGIAIDIPAVDVVLMGFNPRLRLLEYPTSAMKRAAREALAEVGLAGMEESNYQTLSEGQKQLCILARTLVSDAGLLLLDEPESALDFGGRYRMLERVRSWVQSGTRGAVVTLHDPQLALNCCDALLLIQNGGCLGILRPREDSLDLQEKLLSELYGPLALRKVKNNTGKEQIVMVS